MTKKRVFRAHVGGVSHAVDPEALFRDLRGRAPEIRHLWSHQADLLRDYHQQCQNVTDVAIELPTGAGKTLVGLLISEWRRQVFNERVAYLCPTRQLARQVGAQALSYGIKAHVLVGKQSDYPPQEFGEFQSGQAIAVTTYSGVFNVNPRIDNPNVLILDDAHASDNFITSMWSAEILRSEAEDLYHSLVDLLKDGLPPAFLADITDDSEWEPRKTELIELIPGRYVRQHVAAIRNLLDVNLEEKTSPWYAWELIKERINACNVFVSGDSILIRPLIAPTAIHHPFSQARQRVYMSATLGAGGELERITGVKSVKRLQVPAGWDKRGSGRRLFLVPEVAMSEEDATSVVLEAVHEFDRSLVLVPSKYEYTAAGLIAGLRTRGLRVIEAPDIEDNIDPFVSSTGVALVLTRYDGLDLPDEACRLLVIGGHPIGTNLQEKFLWSRIGAFSLLRDRVVTRFAQGVGRCTRSDNDYAVVLVFGRRLVDFILKHESRCILNPELQAELEFGIENSKDKEKDDFQDMWRAFVAQSDEWKDAEEAIVALREKKGRLSDPISERLCSVVGDEVSYLYAMWGGNLELALEYARKVADGLGGDDTKAYRGWWYYLVADAALALHDATADASLLEISRDFLNRASCCCVGISWFAQLVRVQIDAEHPDEDELTAIAVESIRNKLIELGAVGDSFEREINEARRNIRSSEHRAFHRGLKAIGEMLGFRAELPDSHSAPDCVWSIGNALYVSHEAKSEHTPEDPIGANDIRQAQSHENWVRANRSTDGNTQILCLIVSPRKTILADAVPHAISLHHVPPKQIEAMFEQISTVLRRVRSTVCDLSEERVLEQLHSEILAAKLRPRDVFQELSHQLVKDMTKS